MDYFRQRREYRKLKQNEITISMGQNNLYRELLDYANDEGKLDNWFPLKNSALVDLTGLSEAGLKKARNSLIQCGLIEYRQGNKQAKKAPQYRIVTLYKQKNTRVAQVAPQEHLEQYEKSSLRGTEEVAQVVAHKELTSTRHRLDNNSIPSSASSVDLNSENSAVHYWLNQVNPAEAPMVLESIRFWVDDFKGQDEIVILAIDEMLKHGARSYKYLDAVLRSWENKQLDTVEKVKRQLEGHYAKPSNKTKNGNSGKQVTNYGQTLYTYYQNELRFSPNLTLDEYARKKRLNDRDLTALKAYIDSLEENA